MNVRARWPQAGPNSGMYESFYMRAASPDRKLGVWIRYTVQKSPNREPKASVWFTMFDAESGRPIARKVSFERTGLSSPPDAWIGIGDSSIGPDRIEGQAGDAHWSIGFSGADAPLRHLQREWMYRSGLPKTKPESPVPFALFSGEVECDGRKYDLDSWPGMIGHNWGAEHAWTWIWLSGAGFTGDPSAWIDVALGRVRIAGRLTPWVANGAISVDGRRHRLGGMLRRGVEAAAEPGRARMTLPGGGGVTVELMVEGDRESTVCWRYGDPDGHIHDVLNCSVAALRIELTGGHREIRHLRTDHGGTYELGLPERQSWVEPEPYPDEW